MEKCPARRLERDETNRHRGEFSKVIWLNPLFGQLFWAAHIRYSRDRLNLSPNHPWYLINLSHDRGQPMTDDNVRGILSAACQRLRLSSPPHPHALRHMYGDFAANHLQVSLPLLQCMMRHCSILSTETTRFPSSETVRKTRRNNIL